MKKPHISRQVGRMEGWRWGAAEPAGPKPMCGRYKTEGYLRSEGSQPTPDHPAQGSRASSPHNFWLWKLVGVYQQKKLWDSQASPLKGPRTTHGLTQTHSLWTPALGQQLEGHQLHTRRHWSVWHQGKSWETASSQTELQTMAFVPFLCPPQQTAIVQWHHMWISINLAPTVSPTLTIT